MLLRFCCGNAQVSSDARLGPFLAKGPRKKTPDFAAPSDLAHSDSNWSANLAASSGTAAGRSPFRSGPTFCESVLAGPSLLILRALYPYLFN